MKRIFGAALMLVAIAGAQAQARISGDLNCRNDRVSDSNGILIGLSSGLAYQGYPGSQNRLSTWLPRDKVTVCRLGGDAVQITDLSRNSERIKALRIYPENGGGQI